MKTWITYLAAALFGLAIALLFGDMAAATSIINYTSSYMISLGVFISIPLIVFSFTSGIASLRKDGVGRKEKRSIALWSLLTSLLLPVIAGLLFYAFPVAFPVSSSAGSSTEIVSYFASSMVGGLVNGLTPVNPFFSIVTASNMILPLLIICWIFGYALKPNADTIRPAYAVMNSFSEVMFRISRFFTSYGYILTFVLSANFFMQLYQEKTLLVAPKFFVEVAAISAVLLLIVLPLLFLIATKGKKNAYSVFGRSLATMITGLVTSNMLYTLPLSVTLERHNNGVQKRIGATASPAYIIVARGGSAAIATIATLSLIFSLTGGITSSLTILVALSCFICSFASFIGLGSEVLIITYFSLKLLNIELYGAEVAVIALLPLLGGLGTLMDTAITVLGAKHVSFAIETDIETPYQDLI